MKKLAHFSKALSVGALATLLLFASTTNQEALGAATVTTAPLKAQTSLVAVSWWASFYLGITAAVNGPQPTGKSVSLVALEHYQSNDFSQFDVASM